MRDILQLARDSPSAGHFVVVKTLSRLSNFHWHRKSRDLENYVKGCFECQIIRNSNTKPLTGPVILELTDRRWRSFSMDLIRGFLKTASAHDLILIFVDRFSTRPHFIPCKSGTVAVDVAYLFHEHVFKLHGLPNYIISDWDPLFTPKSDKNY